MAPSSPTMVNRTTTMKTRILTVPSASGSPPLGSWAAPSSVQTWLVHPSVPPSLTEAAHLLRTSDIPVAFPTETVYGLGADATRPAAVRGIYLAKGRPSDNPLIVHVCDLDMLQSLLGKETPIPEIYLPLIERFWPGPLTILLPLPRRGILAPEVSGGLRTFGVRMPESALARTLIQLVGKPLAAPSANASTRPSPTTAQHVVDDLGGRIEAVVDGGACAVGVESTVVDGLCEPPAVLRPGGVSVDELRECRGWERVVKAYRDGVETMGAAPRAPGMKYKHYSPRARVVLVEKGGTSREAVLSGTIGVIRTGGWPAGGSWVGYSAELGEEVDGEGGLVVREGKLVDGQQKEVARVLDADLGADVKGVARGLFAALRELDRLGADMIFVEGVDDGEDIAAAVMNRLRKAASEIRA